MRSRSSSFIASPHKFLNQAVTPESERLASLGRSGVAAFAGVAIQSRYLQSQELRRFSRCQDRRPLRVLHCKYDFWLCKFSVHDRFFLRKIYSFKN
jgi:hypothetical protein